jgi:outer membrane lipase/esterase
MRGMLRGLAVGGLALALTGAASAALFTQFVAFGDSLSDAGNAGALSGGTFPPAPLPYAGPASNGPTAAQVLAARLGVEVQLGWPVATAGSNNYAVLGAMNDTRNYNVEIGSPPGLGAVFPAFATSGVASQIARYQAVNPLVADPARTLFLVWGGANDAFLAMETPGATPQSIGLALNQSLMAMGANLQALAGMGARHILVPSLPDLGLTPEALAAGPMVSGFASQV